jgi:hypothetical protein
MRGAFNDSYARRAPNWLNRLRGFPPIASIDLSCADAIRGADPDRLRDARYLERDLLPRLGANDDMPELFPPHMRELLGFGLRYWQYPCQLAPYLAHLAPLGIRRYLEIGVQHGGTFVITTEYLARLAGIADAVAVDVMNVRSLRRYSRDRPEARFVRESSRSDRFRAMLREHGPFDLALIDGDHRYEAVLSDWETVRGHARLVAFHDIVDSLSPGVQRVWREVRERHAGEYDFLEFTEQYGEVRERTGNTYLGIGLAVPKPEA